MDKELEAKIDSVGRDRVFDRAKSLGWAGGSPPKHIWWGIVREIEAESGLK